MDAMIEQEKSSKKKLVIPIVALMLCAVGVIGAGYAITSSVTDDGNSLGAESLSLDLYNNDAGKTQVTTAFFVNSDDIISVSTDRVVSEGAGYSVTINNVAAKTYNLRAVGADSTVSVELSNDFSANTYVKGVTVKMGDKTVALTGASSDNGELGSLTDGEYSQITVSITLAESISSGSATMSGTQFAALVAEIEGTAFDLTFTATVA